MRTGGGGDGRPRLDASQRKRLNRFFALFVILLTLSVSLVPFSDTSEGASDGYYTYTLTTNTDDALLGDYDPIGSTSTGKYTSLNGANSGSWAFDDAGYGPFNSFYAAFDPSQDNRMVGHLDPDDLSRLVDGTSIAGQGYNIMWCLPTVYWLTDSSGNLILTNDPGAGGTAYAHTINGHVYEYIGLGVYEGSTDTVPNIGGTVLLSTSGTEPAVNQIRATFRNQANNQLVNTDGNGENGYAMVWNFYQWELYKYCAIAVMDSWNSQNVAGNGHVFSVSGSENTTGDLDQSGPYAGSRGNSTSYMMDSVKVFIENAWGSNNEYVDGIVINETGYYIDWSSVPTDLPSGSYITHVSQSLPSSGYGSSPSANVYVWGMPTTSSGSSVAGTCDYIQTSSSDTHILYVGGSTSDMISGAYNYGLSYVNAYYSFRDSSNGVGARLAFVFDADPMTVTQHTVQLLDSIDGTSYGTLTVDDGTKLTIPDTPIRNGYVFDGWYTLPSGGVEWDFDDPVTQDMDLYAVWVVELRFVSVPDSVLYATIVFART